MKNIFTLIAFVFLTITAINPLFASNEQVSLMKCKVEAKHALSFGFWSRTNRLVEVTLELRQDIPSRPNVNPQYQVAIKALDRNGNNIEYPRYLGRVMVQHHSEGYNLAYSPYRSSNNMTDGFLLSMANFENGNAEITFVPATTADRRSFRMHTIPAECQKNREPFEPLAVADAVLSKEEYEDMIIWFANRWHLQRSKLDLASWTLASKADDRALILKDLQRQDPNCESFEWKDGLKLIDYAGKLIGYKVSAVCTTPYQERDNRLFFKTSRGLVFDLEEVITKTIGSAYSYDEVRYK